MFKKALFLCCVGIAASVAFASDTTQNDDLGEWYKSADTRIDSLRKKDLSFKTTPNAKVKLELIQHQFPFGTAFAVYGKDSVQEWYEKTAQKYFWYGVPESIFKWQEYEPQKGKLRKKEFQAHLDFFKNSGWDFRAHTLMWGIQLYNYDKHFSNLGTCKEIEADIKKRIHRDLKEYKGKIKEYDVWNEPFHEPFSFDKCGWQLLDSAFVWAHQADPNARLFINEFNVIANDHTDQYYNLVKGLLDRKIPVHGIGVQCHYDDYPVVPQLIKERLDKLASLGLPIKVTELDIGNEKLGMHFTEEEQARRYEVFIRSAFSHPAVEGIIMWGFWDGRHWLKNGGIIALDGREKPAAKAIYKLWHETWTTKEERNADSKGVIKFRGFPGKYKITVNGKTTEMILK